MKGGWRALLCIVLAAACGDAPQPGQPSAASPGDDKSADLRAVDFAPSLGVDLDAMTPTAQGVYITDVRPGRGRTVEPGDRVSLEYSGWLPDGTLFEQRPSPEGFGLSEFVLGEAAPVPGLNSGIAGMRVGGVRRIVVPPEQGYGLVGRPAGVPAGSPLLFEIRLLGVSDAER